MASSALTHTVVRRQSEYKCEHVSGALQVPSDPASMLQPDYQKHKQAMAFGFIVHI